MSKTIYVLSVTDYSKVRNYVAVFDTYEDAYNEMSWLWTNFKENRNLDEKSGYLDDHFSFFKNDSLGICKTWEISEVLM